MPPEIKVNLNPVLAKYNAFVESNQDQKSVSKLRITGKDGTFRVVKAVKQSDWQAKINNNRSRDMFFQGVAKQFNGVANIPKKVLEAMYEKDFGTVMKEDEGKRQSSFLTGKPLEARHIQKVVKAITQATWADKETLFKGSFTLDNKDNLFQDNIFKFALKCLSNAEVDKEVLTQSLNRLFEAALPPEWETSRHFDKTKLKDNFGTQDIKELDSKIKEKISDMVKFREHRDLKKGVYGLLGKLKDVFPWKTYVNRSNNKFQYIENFEGCLLALDNSKSWNVNVPGKGDYAYDAKFKTDADMLEGYDFNADTDYNVNDPKSANAFVRDLLYATIRAEGGKGGIWKDGSASDSQLADWLKAKLKKALIGGEVNKKVEDAIGKAVNLVKESLIGIEAEQIGGEVSPLIKSPRRKSDQRKSDQMTLFAQVKECLASLQGLTEVSEKSKTWFNAVMAKVESFGEQKLDSLMFTQGLTSKFTSEDLETFEDIARHIFGSKAGSDGGAGYIGLFPNNKACKFLTNWTERLGSIGGGLTLAEKNLVSDATERLRNMLLDMAKKIGSNVYEVVSRILAQKSDGKNQGLDLLLRTDVAKAVNCMAPYFIDKNGNQFGWSGITEATKDAFSDLSSMVSAVAQNQQNSEVKGQEEPQKSNSDSNVEVEKPDESLQSDVKERDEPLQSDVKGQEEPQKSNSNSNDEVEKSDEPLQSDVKGQEEPQKLNSNSNVEVEKPDELPKTNVNNGQGEQQDSKVDGKDEQDETPKRKRIVKVLINAPQKKPKESSGGILKGILKNKGDVRKEVEVHDVSGITSKDFLNVDDSTVMSYDKRLDYAQADILESLYDMVNKSVVKEYVQEVKDIFAAIRGTIINLASEGNVPKGVSLLDIPYSIDTGVEDTSVSKEVRNKFYLGIFNAQVNANSRLLALEKTLHSLTDAEDEEDFWAGKLQATLARFTGLEIRTITDTDGKVKDFSVGFNVPDAPIGNFSNATGNVKLTKEELGVKIDEMNRVIAELSSRLQSVGDNAEKREVIRVECEKALVSCMRLRTSIKRSLPIKGLGWVMQYERFYKEFERENKVKELKAHIREYGETYKEQKPKVEASRKEQREFLAQLPTAEDLNKLWDLDSQRPEKGKQQAAEV